ncbi:ion channel [Aestuariivirga sp.]|uniref:ion channel n=1 Tax=Aestuariivirga sp. TaxID=2650926 RepID=UPI0035948BF1
MIKQIAIGTLVIAVTVAVQAEMFNLLGHRFERIVLVLRHVLRRFANTGAITVGVLYIMLIQTINVWIWASVFIIVGAFDSLEPALYFSLVSFTTVGFGDITLGHEWRLLSALTAANGFLSFSWSAAYMVELVRRTT